MGDIVSFAFKNWKLILGGLIIAAAVIGYNVHVNGLIDKAVAANDAKWGEREAKARVAYERKYAELNDKYRKEEKDHADAIAKLGAKLARDAAVAEERRKRDLADALAGRLGLRIPASACGAANAAAPEAGARAGGSDGPATIELPRQITADLFTLANDADSVADQLRTCQAVIEADRKGAP